MPEFLPLHAASDLVRDNTTLALGGMALYRRPVAFVKQLLQRSPLPQNLTLLAFTAGYAADLLVGARVVTSIRTVYFGLEVFGLAPMFTLLAGRGDLNIIEESETSIILGLRAAVQGSDSLPSNAWQGTDLLALRPDVSSVISPYANKPQTAFPAIHIDLTVLHAIEADLQGNIALNNNLGIDQLLVYASNIVVVTTERIVDTIKPTPEKTIIPAAGVDYICEVPNGASPTSCYPHYTFNGREFAEYVERCSNESSFRAYLLEITR